MMIILYASAALTAAALIYLGVSAVRFKKKMDPALKKMNKTAGTMQTAIEEIKTEAGLLSQKQKELREDIFIKKTAIQQTAAEVKGTPHVLKILWNAGKSG
ncbi:hypothetical protein KY305_19065 [Bacillus sp. YC2]|uniref:DUF948 domain-containing protein n=1 Tax=Bacillus sp. YC2 TaxID=2861287 RepID=UPI001CA68624|nr:hypothetical protein [Bacillus sp. YC2]MBY8914823.1 hypothetical protein [Bacillus sp. YC2]